MEDGGHLKIVTDTLARKTTAQILSWAYCARSFSICTLLLLTGAVCLGQRTPPSVSVQVFADQPDGTLPAVWNYFGYDEPNYTYAPNGQKLLTELAALSPVPVHIRTHNLLTSGDGSASLKWGSTNVYTEDASGKPVYSWATLERIFDTFRAHDIKPLIEIGFMPEALSTHPKPYRHNFPRGSIYTGWAYPPKDFGKWAELVFQFVHHLRERYGDSQVKTWLWELWNEPDIEYWKGTPEEYFELYDFTVDAVLRAFPEARVGGPDTTGPASSKAAEFLRMFLEHCARQKNYVTGRIGSRLDFIAFHAKGDPQWQDDHVRMGLARQLASIEEGFKIVSSFPEWRRTPVILGESDPEGCAACSARSYPQNAYRNGELYAAYTAEALNGTFGLASREHIHLAGVVTWAFEFESQPYFDGFRELATNGLDKPVLNTFRMLGLMGSERVRASSSGALPVESVIRLGVRERPDVNVIATRKDHEIEILVWNYHDDALPASATPVDLSVSGLPLSLRHALLEHFRVDSDHSNAYTVWKTMGSPQSPTPAEYAKLERAAQLQPLGSPVWSPIEQGTIHTQFDLPRPSVSLLRISWQ